MKGLYFFTHIYCAFVIYIVYSLPETAEETMNLIKFIQNEIEQYKKESSEKLPKIYSEELLEGDKYGLN